MLLPNLLWATYDVTSYLGDNTVNLLVHENRLVVLKNGRGKFEFPSYLAMDLHNRLHEVYLVPFWQIQLQLAVQELFEILGIPVKPMYPTLLKINNQWVPALVSPLMTQKARKIEELDALALAERTKLILTWYLLGGNGFEAQVLKDETLLLDTFHQAFADYQNRKLPRLQDYFGMYRAESVVVDLTRLRDFSEHERLKFLLPMTQYFRKLAALTKKEDGKPSLLMRIFDAYISQNIQPIGGIDPVVGPFTPNRRSFEQRADTLQEMFEEFLRHKVGGAFTVTPFKWFEFGDAKPVQDFLTSIPVPYIYSMENVPNISNAQYRRKNAKSILLRWLVSNHATQVMAYDTWKAQLKNEDSPDPLKLLRDEAAQHDNTITLVSGESWPKKIQNSLSFQLPQFCVNIRLEKTLLVAVPYHVADRETQHIIRMTLAMKDRVAIEIFPHLSSRITRGTGRFLRTSDHAEIADYAKEKGFKDVIIIEMGRLSSMGKEAYQNQGINLIHLDHHSERHHKFSAGEQFTQWTGYQPNLSQWLSFIMDRSHIWGLSDVLQENLPDPQSRFPFLKQLFKAPRNWDTNWLWREHLEGKVAFDISEREGDPAKEKFELSMAAYPAYPNVIQVDWPFEKIRFWGDPRVTQDVVANVNSRSNQVVWGGDLNRETYFIIISRDGDFETLVETVNHQVKNHSVLADHCWIELRDEGNE